MNKRFALLNLIFLSSINLIFAENFVVEKFTSLADSLQTIFANPSIVSILFYIFMLFGTFSMFKVLLNFIFKNNWGDGHNKAKNSLALMFSFIGTTGIYFLYGSSPETFVALFGGYFGLLIVLFICSFILQFMSKVGKDLAGESKAGYWSILGVGIIISLYLLIGFSHKVISAVSDVNSAKLFKWISETAGDIVAWIIIFVIIGLIVWWSQRNKEEDALAYEPDKVWAEDSKKKKEKEAKVGEVQGILKKIKSALKDSHDISKKKLESLEELQKVIYGGNK